MAHEGTEQPPYQAHVFLHQSRGGPVWVGVMNRPDRPPTTDEIASALVEWRTRRGHRPPTFCVKWWP
jgi:hypothetical protein